jgi:hypothetical protein
MSKRKRRFIMPRQWLKPYMAMGLFTFVVQIWVRAFQCAGFENCGPSFAKALVWAALWPLLWLALLFRVPPLREWLF